MKQSGSSKTSDRTPDDPLKGYWDAVTSESYLSNMRELPRLLEAAKPSLTRPRPVPVRRLACAIGIAVILVGTGFIPVPVSQTSGYLLSGQSNTLTTGELMAALQALPVPETHNLSVSSDASGTVFALFIADSPTEDVSPDDWTRRIESSIGPTSLRIRAIDVTTDRPLAVALMGRLGLTISASGSTRDEIAAQVAAQLSALEGSEAEVTERVLPDGRRSTNITIQPNQE